MTCFRILFGMCLKGIGKTIKPSIEIGGFQVDLCMNWVPPSYKSGCYYTTGSIVDPWLMGVSSSEH